MTLKTNTIYCGDNLDILKGFEDNSVDLCYIDPPFFTSKQYEVIWKDGAEIRSFDNRWVKMGEGRYTKDINVYLNFMEPRLREIHRVLKPTGSFYLHCDWHADSYLRVLCDGIFGYNNLVNSIIWKRAVAQKKAANKYAVATDTILFYVKNIDSEYTFKQQYGEKLASSYAKEFKRDESGKLYRWGPLNAQSSSKVFEWRGVQNTWRYSIDKLEDLLKQGLIRLDKNGKPFPRGLKVYIDEIPKPIVQNIWDDINPIVGGAKERLGYPTQKPEALLERIIKASSNEGDVVLDAFAGCGTTLAVAKRLNRQFVGVDVSADACHVLAKRIGYSISEIVGMPFTAEEIAELTGYQFQNAVIRLLDPSSNTIKVNNRGPDGGIDGSYFDLLISVKKFKAGRKDLDEFVATLYRNKKNEGMFIALEYTSDFTKEVARLGREQKISIYPFTLAEIIAEKHKSLTRKEDKAHGKL